MKNFKIGKEIKSLLLNNSDLTDLIGNKVFPLVANVGTQFPFIVYRRTSYQSASNKDLEDEIVFIEITVVTTKYEDSVNIADLVADTLNRKTTSIIDDIQITDISEAFIDDNYVQKLNFKIYLR